MTESSAAKIIHQGFAVKQGAQYKSWKRRFFVFLSNRTMLYYSNSLGHHTHQKPKGEIHINAFTQFLSESDCGIQWPNGHTPGSGFGICVTGRKLFMYCDSDKEAATWLEVIRKEIQRHPSASAPKAKQETMQLENDEDPEPPFDLGSLTYENLKDKNAFQLITLIGLLQGQYIALQDARNAAASGVSAADQPRKPGTMERGVNTDMSQEVLEAEPGVVGSVLSSPQKKDPLNESIASTFDEVPAIAISDASKEIAAAIVIQRCWRQHQLKQHYLQVKSSAMQRGRGRTLERGTQGVQESVDAEKKAAAEREQMISSRSRRTPSCSLPKSTRYSTVLRTDSMSEQQQQQPSHQSVSLQLQQQRNASISSHGIAEEQPSEEVIFNLKVAAYLFNVHAEKGIKYAIKMGLTQDDPVQICQYLYENPGLNRTTVGEFLGSPSNLGKDVLKAYASRFDFQESPLDQSLRLFLFAFRIPGEAQKIERVMQTFARRFQECNPNLFCHEDTAFILAFSTLMLHTDLHNPSNVKKMTKDEFVRNNRGIDDGADLPRDYLCSIYDRIKKEEFQVCIDNIFVLKELEKRIICDFDLITQQRQFIYEVTVSELFKTGQPRPKRLVTLVLFNDILLITKKSQWDQKKLLFRKALSLFDITLKTLSSPATAATPSAAATPTSPAPASTSSSSSSSSSYEIASKDSDDALFRFAIAADDSSQARFFSELQESLRFCAAVSTNSSANSIKLPKNIGGASEA